MIASCPLLGYSDVRLRSRKVFTSSKEHDGHWEEVFSRDRTALNIKTMSTRISRNGGEMLHTFLKERVNKAEGVNIRMRVLTSIFLHARLLDKSRAA